MYLIYFIIEGKLCNYVPYENLRIWNIHNNNNNNNNNNRRVNHNKQDILVLEKVERKIYIIDIAVPNDVNISRKRNEKINKYANLAIEIKQLWNAQTVKTVPIIIGATGLIHERFQTTIKEKLNIDVDCREIQKIVLLGTANISRYFFSTDYWFFSRSTFENLN